MKLILIILISFLISNCCPKITSDDFLFYEEKNRNINHDNVPFNKLYIGKTKSNYYYHLVFFENGIFEFSILNKTKEDILKNNHFKRYGFFKIIEDNIYLENYGSCAHDMFFKKINIINSDSLYYLGYTHKNIIQYTFGLDPTYNNLLGDKMIYELYKDSNNNTIYINLDTNNIKFD